MTREKAPLLHTRLPKEGGSNLDPHVSDYYSGEHHRTVRMRYMDRTEKLFQELYRDIRNDRDPATIVRREIAQEINAQTAQIDGEELWKEFVDLTGIEAKQRSKSRAFVALCFMHPEKTPSMFLYPSKTLHCYGCSDSMSFGEAVDTQAIVYIGDYSAQSKYVNVDPELGSARDAEILTERVITRRRRMGHELANGLRMARYSINPNGDLW